MKKFLNSGLASLKKSVLVDCINPSDIKGIKKSTELLNRLSMPLSAGVKNLGLVKTGINKNEMPFVKKFEKVYSPADLHPDLLLRLLKFIVKVIYNFLNVGLMSHITLLHRFYGINVIIRLVLIPIREIG